MTRNDIHCSQAGREDCQCMGLVHEACEKQCNIDETAPCSRTPISIGRLGPAVPLHPAAPWPRSSLLTNCLLMRPNLLSLGDRLSARPNISDASVLYQEIKELRLAFCSQNVSQNMTSLSCFENDNKIRSESVSELKRVNIRLGDLKSVYIICTKIQYFLLCVDTRFMNLKKIWQCQKVKSTFLVRLTLSPRCDIVIACYKKKIKGVEKKYCCLKVKIHEVY